MSRNVADLWREIQIRDAAVKAYDGMADDLTDLGNELFGVGCKDIAEWCIDAAAIARRAARAEHIHPPTRGLK